MNEKILKYVLENAVRYNGKASEGSVIGKLIAEDPGIKNRLREISKEIAEAVKKVNSMKPEIQIKEFEKFGGEITKEKKEKITKLPRLENMHKPVVLRFEPSPSGPLHIGHAYVLGLNAEYAKEYNGKLILRIADTNPGNIDPESYKLIPGDGKWLTNNKISKVIIQSDNLDMYYEHALILLKKGHAYICTCSAEEFKELADKKEECPCRNLKVEDNIKRWHDMFTKYHQGEAVMRLKTDIKHKNPAMRDFPLMRICGEEHPRKGKQYRVWPLMNFAVIIDDHESSVTHILRGKDHADNAKRQEFMYNCFGWDIPQTLFVGRINFTGMEVSCSKTKERIKKGEFSGWDDIRLPFLLALKRRGYQPASFIKYAKSIGVTLNDKTVSAEEFFKTINFFNREIIEPIANRYFFVAEPQLIKIEKAPELEVELDLHPDNKKGGRNFCCKGSFYVSGQDKLEEGKLYRLMDCLNFEVKKEKNKTKDATKYAYHSTELMKVKGKAKLIHWLPKDETINVEVLMPDNTIIEGYGEKLLNDLKEGAIVQFVRFGFCRLDKIENDKLVFWYCHN